MQPTEREEAKRAGSASSRHGPDDPSPAPVPGPYGAVEPPPARHLPPDGRGPRAGAIPTALVPSHEARGEQPRERDADGVLLDLEQRAGSDEGAHRHGPLPERRKQVQDHAPS